MSSVGGDKSSLEFNASSHAVYPPGGGCWYRGRQHPGSPIKFCWEYR